MIKFSSRTYFDQSKLRQCIDNGLLDNYLSELQPYLDDSSSNRLVVLSRCYELIINMNLYQIIDQIIDGTNSQDEIALCIAAIDCKRTDILDILMEHNFDINQKIPDDYILRHYSHIIRSADNSWDFLKYVVLTGNYDIYVYLVNHEANPYTERVLYPICDSAPLDIFEYFVDNINKDYLDETFRICLRSMSYRHNDAMSYRHNDAIYQKLDKVLQYFTPTVETIGKIDWGSQENEEVVDYLLSRNIPLDLNKFMAIGCKTDNKLLVEYLLKLGIVPDAEAIKYVFDHISSQISIIQLFIKYDINLSNVPANNKHALLVHQLETAGVNKDTLLSYLLGNVV